jgi:hypothetical protein
MQGACMLPMLTFLLLVLRTVGVYAGFCNHFNIGAFMEKVPELHPPVSHSSISL